MDKDKMVPGTKYLFVFDEPHVSGQFEAVFLRWENSHHCALLDIGRIGPSRGNWYPYELKEKEHGMEQD